MDPRPPGPLDPRCLTELPALYEFAGMLTSNTLYMHGELERLTDSPEVKARIANLCEELNGLAYDFRKEAANLEYKLMLLTGKASRDPDITNPDPLVTLTLLRAMPDEVLLEQLIPIVKFLETDEVISGRPQLSYLLVLESGSNMLKAHARASEAMERIEAFLLENAPRQ